jgi:hypothetical protein
MSEITNTIEIKPIKDLLDLNYKNEPKYKFIVPSYQRGYKWGKGEVEYLLSDIWEFEENKDKRENEIYCLQPIVVKDNNVCFELIDGQQRLTTIFLILSYFEIRCFDLKYSTRIKSGEFLETLRTTKTFTEDERNDNVDYWHICSAWEHINTWMDKMKAKEDFISRFEKCFLEKVKVIWYQVDEQTESREIYSRLNVGKIPLTNAELIKALILSKENKIYQKDKIALIWDRIEIALQDDKLWCFLNNTDDASFKLETRIDFLLDLITNKSEEKKRDERDKYYSFRKFQTIHNPNSSDSDKKLWKEQKIKSLNDVWSRIEDVFQIITDWYNDGKTYHYVGYFISFSLSPKDIHPVHYLINLYRQSTKSEFIKTIKTRIIEDLKFDNQTEIKGLTASIESLNIDFQKNKDEIELKKTDIEKYIENYLQQQKYNNTNLLTLRKILLLFNILTVMQNQRKLEEKNGKQTLQTVGNLFPFDLFKKENGWDIEHVHSQTDKKIIKTEEQIEWLLNTFNDSENEVRHFISKLFSFEITDSVTNDNTLHAEIQNAINALPKDKFDELKQNTTLFIEQGISDKDSLFNLTLLDCGTNRSYQNALYPSKRRILLNKDKDGQFVPICTKNLFQKYYTTKSVKISSWNDPDAEGYKAAMVNLFTNMLIGKI